MKSLQIFYISNTPLWAVKLRPEVRRRYRSASYEEGAEEDEGDEVGDGDVGATLVGASVE